MSVKESVRGILLEQGADVCGFGAVERFCNAPEGFSPLDSYAGCQTVIAFGVALPKGVLEANARLVYAYYNAESCKWADKVAFASAKAIESRFDCVVAPLPSDGPYEYWEPDALRGKGLLSMKHAAELCGLGRLGKNTLLLNPRYGNRLVLGALLTDLALESDPLSPSVCLPGCSQCVDSCPTQAIGEGSVNQRLCRPHSYGKTARGFDTVLCNRCRALCPMRYGKPGA